MISDSRYDAKAQTASRACVCSGSGGKTLGDWLNLYQRFHTSLLHVRSRLLEEVVYLGAIICSGGQLIPNTNPLALMSNTLFERVSQDEQQNLNVPSYEHSQVLEG